MIQSASSICRLETKEKMSAGVDLTERVVVQHQATEEPPHAYLRAVARVLQSKPFIPHPGFRSGHAQTFAAYYWPRRRFLLREHTADEARIFEVENVVRLNLRNCGNTEHMTPTLYHAGLISDLRVILKELVEQDGLKDIFMVGFSMGGNMTLMLAGHDADTMTHELAGVVAVSPTIDLRSCVDAIELRSNRLYKYSFLRSMKNRIRRKQKLFPELYETKNLGGVRTLRDFDERYTRVCGGFSSAAEYYEGASALQFIRHIRTPTLMIHAHDDPFVPFQPFLDPSIAETPSVIFIAPQNGGHVGFVGAAANNEDRFWMENRVVEFCKLVHRHTAGQME
jgi:predicted alpha/beta-fold hydrolase